MKNAGSIETVDKSKHAKLRVKNEMDFDHASQANLASIALSEMGACASNFPIVFVQNPTNNQYRLVAILGLRLTENVYYNKDGWECTHVPLTIQAFPFTIGFDDRVEGADQFATCLDVRSPLVGEVDGVALYTDTGEETEFLQSRHAILNDIFEGEKSILMFAQKLLQLGLLIPVDIMLQPETGEPRRVTGMLTVSEAKLRTLTPDQVQDLYKTDLLAACYLMLGSLFQFHRLLQIRGRKGFEKIIGYQIDMDPKPAA